MLSFSRGLWRHQNFMLLWAGQTVSLFGTQITTLALPTIAILLLHVTPFEVGVLAAIPWVAYLGLGLFAGVTVDRMPRRIVMMIADIERAVALGSIPLAFTLGVRSIYHLYLVAAIVGILNVFFEIAYHSYLPTLVEPGELIEGNAKLSLGDGAAQMGGPALAGFLIEARLGNLRSILGGVGEFGDFFLELGVGFRLALFRRVLHFLDVLERVRFFLEVILLMG